jgi:hypothetical protein
MNSRVFWYVNAVSTGEELIQISKASRSSETPAIYLPVDQSTGGDIPEGLSLCCKTYRRDYQIFTTFILLFTSKKNVVSSTEGPFSVRNFIIAPFVWQCCVCK